MWLERVRAHQLAVSKRALQNALFTPVLQDAQEKAKMKRWRNCFRKKEKPVEYWDCSHLSLTLLPKEVFKHRDTITKLIMNANCIKDVPRVR